MTKTKTIADLTKNLFLSVAGTVALWLSIPDRLSHLLQEKTSHSALAESVIVAAVVTLGLLLYIWFLTAKNRQLQTELEKQSSLTPINGIYKDQAGNPFCPICQVLISHYSPLSGHDPHHYYCPKCQKFFATDPKRSDDDDDMMPFSVY